MYIGLLSLYLITSDLSVFSDLDPRWTAKYTNKFGFNIDVKTYCFIKTCIVKCCNYDQVMDDSGTCVYANRFESYIPKINYSGISVYSWDEVSQFKQTKENIKTHLLLAPSQTWEIDRYIPEEFYFLEDGSLKMRIIYPVKQWMEVPPLRYCMDFGLNYTTPQQNLSPVSIRLLPNDQRKAEATEQIKFVIPGTMISLLTIVLLVFCMSPQLRSTITPIVAALTLTLVVGYILKIVQLYALSAGVPKYSECSVFSPAYYFFILSNFFWTNMLIFDMWWRMRGFHKFKRNFHQRDLVRFVWYCVCSWGIPLLMTVVAVLMNISTPFHSCYLKEIPTLLYLHVPVAILIIAHCVIFSMLISQTMQVKLDISNSSLNRDTFSKQLFAAKHIVFIATKLVVGAGIICLLGTTTPIMLYAALIVFSVHFWVLYFVFDFIKSTLEKQKDGLPPNCHLSGTTHTEFSKEVADEADSKASHQDLQTSNEYNNNICSDDAVTL